MARSGSSAVLLAVLLSSTDAEPQSRPIVCDVFDRIEVRFSQGNSVLPAAERERVMQEAARIRRANYCPFGGVTVSGHTNSTEGPTKTKDRLAVERSSYVARLLEQGGIPKQLIHVEASGDRVPVMKHPDSRNARAEVTVRAGCPSDSCMFPVSASGFRLPK